MDAEEPILLDIQPQCASKDFLKFNKFAVIKIVFFYAYPSNTFAYIRSVDDKEDH